MKRRVFFGLGSNLGDRQAYIDAAIAALPDVIKVSSMYETDPVGGPPQPDFLNCVVECFTDIGAPQLLNIAQQCELEAQRVRTVVNGPRTLDVDIIYIDGETIDTPELTVPHPRMRERLFVLEPLHELAPDLVSEQELINVRLRD